jgi:hypothetical protein
MAISLKLSAPFSAFSFFTCASSLATDSPCLRELLLAPVKAILIQGAGPVTRRRRRARRAPSGARVACPFRALTHHRWRSLRRWKGDDGRHSAASTISTTSSRPTAPRSARRRTGSRRSRSGRTSTTLLLALSWALKAPGREDAGTLNPRRARGRGMAGESAHPGRVLLFGALSQYGTNGTSSVTTPHEAHTKAVRRRRPFLPEQSLPEPDCDGVRP